MYLLQLEIVDILNGLFSNLDRKNSLKNCIFKYFLVNQGYKNKKQSFIFANNQKKALVLFLNYKTKKQTFHLLIAT